jgi:hypothetical protein
MCHHIEAEFVLANYFLCFSEPLTFGKLRKIREAIETSISECTHVDVSTPSLASAIELYPQLFRWHGNVIAKAEESDRIFNEQYVEDTFNSELKSNISLQAVDAIKRLYM